LYGENFIEIDPSMLNSPHNEWAQYKQLVLGDEITGAELGGNRKVTIDTLKGLTTRQSIFLNPKYIGGYTIPDCINYLFTSNHPDAFRLEDQDRRFAIFELGPPLSPEFYNPYYDSWYKSDKLGALFYKFLHLDLTGFNPYQEAPVTRAKKDMISDSRSDLGAWVAQLAVDPKITSCKRTLWTTTELYGVYRSAGGSERVTVNGLARELKRQGLKKAMQGDPVMTSLGAQKLWWVGGTPVAEPKKIARQYDLERSADKAYQEFKVARKKKS